MSKKIRTLILLMAIPCSTHSVSAEIQTSIDRSIPFVNLDETSRFISILATYSDGRNIILCAERTDHKVSLWDISDNKTLGEPREKCDALNNFRELYISVGDTSELSSPRLLSRDTSFLNGYSISTNIYGSASCTLNFSHKILLKNGKISFEYYFIAKSKTPETVSVSEYCDGSNGISQEITMKYNEISGLNSVAVPGKGALVFSSDRNIAKILILLMTTIPSTKKIWSYRDEFYIIPANMMDPKLDEAGSDIAARYRAVTTLLARR